MKLFDVKMNRFLWEIVVLLGVSLTVPTYAWTTITVQSGQSIDGIAEKYRPAGVSEMDMIIAVRSANPGVEYKGLRPGVKLKIPTTTTEVRQAIIGDSRSSHVATKVAIQKAAPTKATAEKNKNTVMVKANKPISKPPIKPIVKTPPAAKPKVVAAPVSIMNQSANDKTTIANLQQMIANQNQSIEAYQAQIANLTQQLSNGSGGASVPVVKSSGFFSFADLWFFLWLVTLIFLWRARSRNQTSDTKHEERHVPVHEPIVPSMKANISKDVVIEKTKTAKTTERIEPKLHEINEEEWRQVELDIPAADAPAQTHMSLVPTFTPEEERELNGEQENIIEAIAKDHDNLEWHMALLEFYIKTMNDAAFKRHMDTMIHTGLMTEGDTLWEKVRKMYLNGWIYKEEAV